MHGLQLSVGTDWAGTITVEIMPRLLTYSHEPTVLQVGDAEEQRTDTVHNDTSQSQRHIW